ncbi:MAG: 3-methyl-2-oxobutanoate hydroxymethyltransferase [Magnetococcales bacterium]|nr:3-methyl-2-oxobutanoate hydroxymethyltransferase [Magnetococcales bacterium]
MTTERPVRVTIPDLRRMKSPPSAAHPQQRIVAVTAYDYTFARLLDQCGVDILLVGDSLGMVIHGADNTLAVTLDDMIYHARAVARAAQRAMVICDLPFGAFQCHPEAALTSAIRVLKESGSHAVKIEGGRIMAETVRFLVARGVPVIGHIGLTPQSVHAMGGFRMQGRDQASASRLLEDARVLDEAGASIIVLEGIPMPLAQQITQTVQAVTIGIGAGPGCDGQVLVLYDLLGLDERFQPRFVKRYMDGAHQVRQAVMAFADEVRKGTFPAPEHTVME